MGSDPKKTEGLIGIAPDETILCGHEGGLRPYPYALGSDGGFSGAREAEADGVGELDA